MNSGAVIQPRVLTTNGSVMVTLTVQTTVTRRTVKNASLMRKETSVPAQISLANLVMNVFTRRGNVMEMWIVLMAAMKAHIVGFLIFTQIVKHCI